MFRHCFRSCYFWLYFQLYSSIDEIENLKIGTIFEFMTPSSILSFRVLQSPINVRQDFPQALYFELAYFFMRGICQKMVFICRQAKNTESIFWTLELDVVPLEVYFLTLKVSFWPMVSDFALWGLTLGLWKSTIVGNLKSIYGPLGVDFWLLSV